LFCGTRFFKIKWCNAIYVGKTSHEADFVKNSCNNLKVKRSASEI